MVYFFSINIWTRPALFVRDERYAFFHTQVCQRARWFGERICKGSQETSGQVSQHRGIWSAYCESEKKLSFRNKKCESTLFARFTPKDRKKGAPPESSQTSCFRSSIVIIVYKYKYIYEFTIVIRLLLCEVGYQAGQHELLSESLGMLWFHDVWTDFQISKLDSFIGLPWLWNKKTLISWDDLFIFQALGVPFQAKQLPVRSKVKSKR